MSVYRKKPVEIEAVTFAEFEAMLSDRYGTVPWPDSFDYQGHTISGLKENGENYMIPTPEGAMAFTKDDMLITGVKGEIYPCKLDIFALTYDAV